MFSQTVPIDHAGRITLPKQILDALGLPPETEVIIELTETGAVIKSRCFATPITERIAAMGLPVSDWDQMEQEIEAGRLK